MKQMLMIRACGIQGENGECDNIKTQAQLYGIAVDDISPKTNLDLKKALGDGIEYDYIYLSTHGNHEGFCDEDGGVDMSWIHFALELCEGGCMTEDCVVMLSCCRGGLNQVAYNLFFCCTKIAYVIGPRQSLDPTQMLISFNILLYNLVQRNIDPVVSCEKIKLATDIRFVCFDRMETEAEVGYITHTERYTGEEIEIIELAREKAAAEELAEQSKAEQIKPAGTAPTEVDALCSPVEQQAG